MSPRSAAGSHPALIVAASAAIYGLLAVIAESTRLANGSLLVALPTAFAVAVIAGARRSVLPWAVLGITVAAVCRIALLSFGFLPRYSVAAAIVMFFAILAGPIVAGFAVRRLTGGALRTVADFGITLAACAVVLGAAALLSDLASVLAFREDGGATAIAWFIGSFGAVAVFAPVFFARSLSSRRTQLRGLLPVGIIGGIWLAAAAIFLAAPAMPVSLYLAAAVALAPWAAIRTGLAVVAAAAAGPVLLCAFSIAAAVGPFAGTRLYAQLIAAQWLMIAAALSAYIAALVHEQHVREMDEHQRTVELARRDRESSRQLLDFKDLAERSEEPPIDAAVHLLYDLTDAHRIEARMTAGSREDLTDEMGDAAEDAAECEVMSVSVSIGGDDRFELTAWVDPGTANEAVLADIALAVGNSAERLRLESDLRKVALNDELTGLPGWQTLLRTIDSLALEEPDSWMAVLYFDVPDLKSINIDHGAVAGDAVLHDFANRIAEAVTDRGVAARVGGDEFVLAQLCDSPEGVREWANRCLEISSVEVQMNLVTLTLQVRAGLATAPAANAHPADLLRDAQIAAIRAKATDQRLTEFTREFRDKLLNRRSLERELRLALERDQVFPYFQPQVDLQTGRIHGVEALARWRHPDQGFISPGVFIPIAEDSGLITELGAMIMRKSIAQLAAWDAQSPELRELRMSVNFAASQIADERYLTFLEELLTEHGVAPRRVTIEVTEEGIERDPERTATRMEQFRDFGLAISLDDFGTGYSTLSRLMELPVNEIKIDRRFVIRLDQKGTSIISALMGLARGLGMQVVAEGIETDEQKARLLDLDCDFGQGFLFDPAIDAKTLADRVIKGTQLAG